VVATTSRGKLEEFASLLVGLPVELHALGDVCPAFAPVVEDGATFADNALKKARAAARRTGMIALADDSGLEVDALGGRPGVHSARFAGEHATDAENNAALLAALSALAGSASCPAFRARFRCALALVDPRSSSTEPLTSEGVCEGLIAAAPRGKGGFGYDPLFIVAGTHQTFAELDRVDKNRLSHRARAVAALRRGLERLLVDRASG
jgi:XTP/dITP diphosphohydrolase